MDDYNTVEQEEKSLNWLVAEAIGWTECGFYRQKGLKPAWHGGIPPGKERDRDFPHWAQDANAALELLADTNYAHTHFNMNVHDGKLWQQKATHRVLIYGANGREIWGEGYGNVFPIAATRAYLAYRQLKELTE